MSMVPATEPYLGTLRDPCYSAPTGTAYNLGPPATTQVIFQISIGYFIFGKISNLWLSHSKSTREVIIKKIIKKTRDEDPELFSTDPDPAQLKKNSGSGSDLKSK